MPLSPSESILFGFPKLDVVGSTPGLPLQIQDIQTFRPCVEGWVDLRPDCTGLRFFSEI
jgi:hypothetical protein